MKNLLFFMVSILISVAAYVFSVNLEDIELGICTIICIWVFFLWNLFNKINQTKKSTDSF